MGTQLPSRKRGQSPQFSAYFYCGQTPGPLPGHTVLEGDLAPKKGVQSLAIYGPCLLWPNGWMDQDATWYGGRHKRRRHCVRQGPRSPSLMAHCPEFLAHVRCGQTAGSTKMPFGTEVGLGPGDFMLDRDPGLPLEKGHSPSSFQPMSIVAKWLNGYRCHLVQK